MSLTFMAKFDEREGNSCHIHLSLRGADGAIVFADDGRAGGHSAMFEQLRRRACWPRMRELTLLLRAEHQLLQAVRSRARSRRPRSRWGADNRTCALRRRRARRRRCGWRTGCPAATSTPTWRVAGDARRRAARHRAASSRSSRPFEGNAYASGQGPACRRTLREARDLFAGVRASARAAFGDEVVDHYANAADVELAAFDAAVTDWERVRGFERL